MEPREKNLDRRGCVVVVVVVVLHDINPPTPCLWQAPASTQKIKRKTRPAIRRSARWRVKEGRATSEFEFDSNSDVS